MKNDIVFIESGRKRKGEKHNCEFCGKEFIRRKTETRGKSKRFCSILCSAQTRVVEKIILNCYNCGIEIRRKKSDLKKSKHGFYFCSRSCKEESQSLHGDCLAIRPSHYKDGSTVYRKWVMDIIEKGCTICDEKNKYQIAVHHVDMDRSNNDMSNLEVVCHRCHCVRHLKKTKGEWVFHPASLTPRDIVEEMDLETRKIMQIV